jgi:hypothetical protein
MKEQKMDEKVHPDRRDMIEIWGLYAFDDFVDLQEGIELDWLEKFHDAACYQENRSALPFGGWTSQGYACEIVAKLAVTVDDPRAPIDD